MKGHSSSRFSLLGAGAPKLSTGQFRRRFSGVRVSSGHLSRSEKHRPSREARQAPLELFLVPLHPVGDILGVWCNGSMGGSNPFDESSNLSAPASEPLAQVVNAADCKSAYAGSNPAGLF